MTNDDDFQQKVKEAVKPALEHFDAAVSHVDEMVSSGTIAASAARGILYSLIETLGTLVGDPDLPEHARSGYEGLLESARELRVKLER
ncbi:hypothetical protein QS306_17210 [Paraburkholderia bonniea]|uniref:hypothetical protein n=1 Tax=Paraburkholderia bonniea TaxID=2152891 RepID=UPI0012914024|nr:hypothetical protein [Paraburkholderia bonniea]WJF91805.1 hypothetical protein QS306_17210 [Paraburkholderia bonniea]WJF95124.1 hypothetical protein QS308_17210 [Paraburkholderia bonniea]